MDDTKPYRVESLVDEIAARQPDHPALIFGTRHWTGAQLRDETRRRAAILRDAGLSAGAVVATTELVTDHVALAFLSCCRADLTFLHLAPTMTVAELAPLMRSARVALTLTAEGGPHPACPYVPALPIDLPGSADETTRERVARRCAHGSPEAAASLIATSGTTGGTPKLVRTPHRAMTWRGMTPLWWEPEVRVSYRLQTTAFNARTFCTLLRRAPMIVLTQTLDPRRMEEEMIRHKADSVITTPAVVRLLAEQTEQPPRGLGLRYISTGGAPMPATVRQAAERRYGATLIQEYASSEGGALLGTPAGGAPVGSIGVPYVGVEARIVDADGDDVPDGTTGELIVRSPGLMLGYIDNPAATAAALRAGWLWTGDRAHRDADGFFFLAGRRALQINVGGFKVAPEEVEAVLERHPAIREAVVLATPDARRGEVVRAVIVARGDLPAIGTLRRYCRAQLAGYKVPRRWEFRDELPRSPLGKILRHLL